MPLVSVVMPVFNGEKYLAEAIDSILVQTFTDFELIIVDDGSQDGSAEIIEVFTSRDDRIRLFRLEKNKGIRFARNVAVEECRGEYITFMDCDDVSLPQRLQKQVDLLDSSCDIGAVGTYAKVVNADFQQMYDRKPPQHHALILLDQYIGDPFVHTTLMMRRELHMEAGGYDLSLRHATDVDLMTRLMGRTLFANIAECLYIYRRHTSQATSRKTAARDRDSLLVRSRRLERLWGVAPRETLDRFVKLRPWYQLSWRERRAAKRDLKRLIESMIAAGWVETSDRPLLFAEMNSRLEQASPRRWQMFCHWRRHHFQR